MHIEARIIALANPIDPMLVDRHHRRALSVSWVFDELSNFEDVTLDPTVADVTMQVLYTRRDVFIWMRRRFSESLSCRRCWATSSRSTLR